MELTKKTDDIINALFESKDRKDAADLLKLECANNLPFCKDSTPESLEKVRFAALKVSDGKLDKLYYAVDLAQKDWRDLLVFSGLADDTKAHEIWAKITLNR